MRKEIVGKRGIKARRQARNQRAKDKRGISAVSASAKGKRGIKARRQKRNQSVRTSAESAP